MSRPPVTVVVPFAGSDRDLARLLDALAQLDLGPGDELRVADNEGSDRHIRPGITIVDAAGIRTPAFARNAGARGAHGDWLVFIDADTRPCPDLLDRYFSPAPSPRTAVLAGGIRDVAARPTPAARHAVARRHLGEAGKLSRGHYEYAQTANCAVRRTAFDAIGGFEQGARAGEDADLCIRLARDGWSLEERPDALVAHVSREDLGARIAQLARHGAGAAWLNHRYPGSFPPPSPLSLLRRIGRAGLEAFGALAHGRLEEAAFAVLDIAGAIAFECGRMLRNGPADDRRLACGRGVGGTSGLRGSKR